MGKLKLDLILLGTLNLSRRPVPKLEIRFGTRTGIAWHSLCLSFSFEPCFCVKCVCSAQFMSGSTWRTQHNGMKRSASASACIHITFSLWSTCSQTRPVCFPFAAFCFLLDSFLSFSLGGALRSIETHSYCSFAVRRTKDQSQAPIGQELCGQNSDWLRLKQAPMSQKTRCFFKKVLLAKCT